MELENYRDLSQGGSDVGAGFQFEFYCTQCSRGKWKSAFRPYRMGQFTGLLMRFAFLFSSARTVGRTTGNFADMGSRGARDKALADATEHAQTLYVVCDSCDKAVCKDCFDGQKRLCNGCLKREREESAAAAGRDAGQAMSPATGACPNCQLPMSGGRFCAECGFDMASTHKSCPSCGVMLLRQARFCIDCGHGF